MSEQPHSREEPPPEESKEGLSDPENLEEYVKWKRKKIRYTREIELELPAEVADPKVWSVVLALAFLILLVSRHFGLI